MGNLYNHTISRWLSAAALAIGVLGWHQTSPLIQTTRNRIDTICSDPQVQRILTNPDTICVEQDGSDVYLLEQGGFILILTMIGGVVSMRRILKRKIYESDEVIKLYQIIYSASGIEPDTEMTKRANQILSNISKIRGPLCIDNDPEYWKNIVVLSAIYDADFSIEQIQRCSTFPIESNKPTISSDFFIETEEEYLKKIKNIIRLMLVNPHIKDVYNRTQSSNQNIAQSSRDNLVNFINTINTRIKDRSILHIHENNNHKGCYEPYLADFDRINPESIPDQYQSVGEIRYCLYRLYLDLRDTYRYGLFPYAPYNILTNRIHMEKGGNPNFDTTGWEELKRKNPKETSDLQYIIEFLAKQSTANSQQ